MTAGFVVHCDAPDCTVLARITPTPFGASAPLGWLCTTTTNHADPTGQPRHYDLCSAACHERLLDAIATAQASAAGGTT